MKTKRILSLRFEKGQSLIVGMALMAVAASCVFLVFNSNRAVNDKINLVNAADAAAYSGAQMAARELNFMALTNRTMIANEVAIGHMMSYQTEIDLVIDGLGNGSSGFVGAIINAFVAIIGKGTLENIRNVNQVWSGAYILAVNSLNKLYGSYQDEEYRALAAIGRDSIVDSAMSAVAAQYVKRPSGPALAGAPVVSIQVNNVDTINSLATSTDPVLQSVAARFAAGNPFCSFIMFVSPSTVTATDIYAKYKNDAKNPLDYRAMALDQACQRYYSDGTMPTVSGFTTNPEADGGVFLKLLNQSSTAAPSTWVNNRNDDYKILGVNMHRRGGSQAIWDTANNQLNWKTNGNDTLDSSGWGILFSFHGKASGDAKQLADTAAGQIGGAVKSLLELAGLCSGADCDVLNSSSYTGVTRYAVLNPMRSNSTGQAITASEGPLVTAVVSQSAYCNDSIGFHKEGDNIGQQREDWFEDEQSMPQPLPNHPINKACVKEVGDSDVVAYSQARVFYSRPTFLDLGAGKSIGFKAVNTSLGESETSNLFNPFWQAKLVSPDGE